MSHEVLIVSPRLRVRYGTSADDARAALALRTRVFRAGTGQDDGDAFDALCRHVLIEDRASGALLGTYRLMFFAAGSGIGASYAAQFYDLDGLAGFDAPMIELGRFCLAPEARATDVLRLAWAALTRIVDAEGVGMLFGCTSFEGTGAGAYRNAFAQLRAQHGAPRDWQPGVKAGEVVPFEADPTPDPQAALREMPPLLRTYLIMGGWVSDHAVVDRDLGTLHVFTGLEIAKVPEGRARALRALAAG